MGQLIMVYDTETTGKSDFKAAYNDPRQPNLVQLGYKVYDRSKRVIFEVGHLVDTTVFAFWTGIEPDAQAIHGVDEASIRLYGWDPDTTMKLFMEWAQRCDLFIAHNDQFDTRIMQCFASRSGWNPAIFHDAKKYCTMTTSTHICKIPQTNGRAGNKWPKLNEAYPYFMDGAQFKDAHNALADVNACGDIFWAHVERGIFVLEESNG